MVSAPSFEDKKPISVVYLTNQGDEAEVRSNRGPVYDRSVKKRGMNFRYGNREGKKEYFLY